MRCEPRLQSTKTLLPSSRMTAGEIAAPCAVAVISAGEYAPGKIATELLFSHRNDAKLVLTGIAKARPQHGTAPPPLALASFTSGNAQQ
jgi:hypothetical protein